APAERATPRSLRLFDALDRDLDLVDLTADPRVDLGGHGRVLAEEVLGRLAALAEPGLAEVEPGAGLADDVHRDAHVEQAPFLGHALAVHHVELGDAERRRDLVLHDLDPHPVADRLGAGLDRLDAPDVQADRGVELQRAATGGRLRIAEHHADLLAQLVREDEAGVGAGDGAGQLAQRLAHEPGLDADERVAHLALDLGAGHEGRDRVDDDAVDAARADQGLGDLQRLLTGVRLRHEQLVDVDATGAGVAGVERVLDIDEGDDAATPLRLGEDVLADRRLARRLRAEDLRDPTARDAADTEREVERDRPRRDRIDGLSLGRAELHDRPATELLLDRQEGRIHGLATLRRGPPGRSLVRHRHPLVTLLSLAATRRTNGSPMDPSPIRPRLRSLPPRAWGSAAFGSAPRSGAAPRAATGWAGRSWPWASSSALCPVGLANPSCRLHVH